jgi:hypothetical protein
LVGQNTKKMLQKKDGWQSASTFCSVLIFHRNTSFLVPLLEKT